MDTQQNLTTNFRQPFDLRKDMSYSREEIFEPQSDEQKETPELSSTNEAFYTRDLDLDSLRSLQLLVVNEYPLYLIDYSFPSEINTDGFALRFGDLKVDYLKKTRLALAISTTILSISLVTAVLALPYPYKIGALALCGPLFVSTYGLVTQK